MAKLQTPNPLYAKVIPMIPDIAIDKSLTLAILLKSIFFLNIVCCINPNEFIITLKAMNRVKLTSLGSLKNFAITGAEMSNNKKK